MALSQRASQVRQLRDQGREAASKTNELDLREVSAPSASSCLAEALEKARKVSSQPNGVPLYTLAQAPSQLPPPEELPPPKPDPKKVAPKSDPARDPIRDPANYKESGAIRLGNITPAGVTRLQNNQQHYLNIPPSVAGRLVYVEVGDYKRSQGSFKAELAIHELDPENGQIHQNVRSGFLRRAYGADSHLVKLALGSQQALDNFNKRHPRALEANGLTITNEFLFLGPSTRAVNRALHKIPERHPEHTPQGGELFRSRK